MCQSCPTPAKPATPEFATEEAAWAWVDATIDDGCVDNYRFAYLDEPGAERRYNDQKFEGCCGFFDAEVIVGGRRALIGCNYGH